MVVEHGMSQAEFIGPDVEPVDAQIALEVMQEGEDDEALIVVLVVNFAPDRGVFLAGASVEASAEDDDCLVAEVGIEIDLFAILVETHDVGQDVARREAGRHGGLVAGPTELDWIAHWLW